MVAVVSHGVVLGRSDRDFEWILSGQLSMIPENSERSISRMTIYRPPSEHPHLDATDTGLLEAVAAGEARLTPEQGLSLLMRAPLHTLGRTADARARHIHGDDLRTYVIDRNINYTNVCSAKCTFCAFRRDADEHDA